MARNLSSNLQTAISSDQTKIAFLVEFNFSSVLRATDWFTDVVYDSNTYSAGGSFLSVDSVAENGEVKIDQLQINVSNVTTEVRNLVIAGNYTNVKVNVYLAFFDANDAIIDAINYFTGYIKSVNIAESKNSSTIQLVVANHWSNWNLTKGRHFTDESQQKYSSGDKGLEYGDQAKVDVRWGS